MDSIILNCNTDLYGNQPFKFVNHFSENIEIKQNQEIALYSVNLEKPIIHFTEDQHLEFDLLINQDHTSLDNIYSINSFNDLPSNIIITMIVPKGDYSSYSLLKYIETEATQQWRQFLKDNATQFNNEYEQYWQYSVSARFVNGKPQLFMDSYYPTVSLDGITDNTKRRNVLFGTGSTYGDMYPNNLSNVGGFSDWDTFGCYADAVNPINGLTDFNTEKNIRKSSIYFELDHNLADEGDYYFCFGNLKNVNTWTDIDHPMLVPTSDDITLPVSWMGARFSFTDDGSGNKSCEIALYENNALSSNVTLNAGQVMNCVYKTTLDDLSQTDPNFFINNVFGFTFYQKNDQQLTEFYDMNTYYKFHTTSTNSDMISLYDNGTIYDSSQNGRVISSKLIINTLKYGDPYNTPATIPRTDMSTQGLQPFGFMNNLATATGTNKQYGFKKVRGNRLRLGGKQQSSDVITIYSYNVKVNSKELQNVFSFSEKKRICPVYFDISDPDYETVITDELYQENKSYNIIVKNLPLRTHYATNKDVNIGSKSSIVYNLNGVFNNKVVNPSTSFVAETHYPKQLKFLKCDNKQPIRLNNLEIEIRNAKTNQLATEITDASIELIIK